MLSGCCLSKRQSFVQVVSASVSASCLSETMLEEDASARCLGRMIGKEKERKGEHRPRREVRGCWSLTQCAHVACKWSICVFHCAIATKCQSLHTVPNSDCSFLPFLSNLFENPHRLPTTRPSFRIFMSSIIDCSFLAAGHVCPAGVNAPYVDTLIRRHSQTVMVCTLDSST
jgi:hypothetical protein